MKEKTREVWVSTKIYNRMPNGMLSDDKFECLDAQDFQYEVIEDDDILPVIQRIDIDHGFDEVERCYVVLIKN